MPSDVFLSDPNRPVIEAFPVRDEVSEVMRVALPLPWEQTGPAEGTDGFKLQRPLSPSRWGLAHSGRQMQPPSAVLLHPSLVLEAFTSRLNQILSLKPRAVKWQKHF
jgi:hypothetical protein